MRMTISIVIMHVTVSVVAMYVTVSSSNFIFLSIIYYLISHYIFQLYILQWNKHALISVSFSKL